MQRLLAVSSGDEVATETARVVEAQETCQMLVKYFRETTVLRSAAMPTMPLSMTLHVLPVFQFLSA